MDEALVRELSYELDQLKAQVRYALDNLDELPKRHDVRGRLQNVYFTLDELCEQTKGESK